MAPNILVFIPHDLGDTLHCYGHQAVRSPNLDAMAERGVRFAECYTTSPECTPSRGGLWSGYHTYQNGLMGLSNFGWELKKPHLAQRLAKAGYATHLFGVQHETAADPTVLGYQHVEPADRRISGVSEAVIRFLAGPEANSSQPWFACVGFHDVHRRWEKPSTFDPAAIPVPPYLPDTPAIRKDLALFYQNIEDMDAAVGRMLDALAASPAGVNTLAIFTTDHGSPFPHAKATVYDPGLHVPLICHGPGIAEGGRTCPHLLSNLDVTPTLLDLAGIPLPGDLPGHSFAPWLRDEPYQPRNDVDGALLFDVAYDPVHWVRSATHKYIRSFAVTPEQRAAIDPDLLTTFVAGQWVRVDDYDVLASAAWRSMASPQPIPPEEELYDLQRDPHELNNLAGTPDAAPILAEMRRRLEAIMQATDSPLCNGHVTDVPQAQRDATARYRPGGPMYANL